MGHQENGSADLTRIFAAIQGGDENAESRLFAVVYEELRRMAHGKMIRESPDHTLQTTALVHEAYLKLCGDGNVAWDNRRHFFGAAANAMRQILVDRARRRDAEIHGGRMKRVPLADDLPSSEKSLDILALDEALTGLAAERPRHADVVLHRFFLGLTVKETADLLGVASRTVDTDWQFAKSWLRREMTRRPDDPPEADRDDG
jgi:RNA polymerase sigma factor (TIGR02999 family)